MAGYCGYSKSCNAVKAEQNGMLPLSRITGAPKWAVSLAGEIVGWCEWHHTSKRYNVTYYYDVERVLSVAGSLKRQYGNAMAAKSEITRKRAERLALDKSFRAQIHPRLRLNCLAWSAGRSTGKNVREVLHTLRDLGLSVTCESYRNLCAELSSLNDKNN